MREPTIENRLQLKKRIMELHSVAYEQDQMITHKFHELFYSVQPATILRRWVSNLKEDGEMRHDLMKAGKDAVLNFAASSVLKKGSMMKGGLLLFAANRLARLLFKKKTKKTTA